MRAQSGEADKGRQMELPHAPDVDLAASRPDLVRRQSLQKSITALIDYDTERGVFILVVLAVV
jgi:hypothetical protein